MFETFFTGLDASVVELCPLRFSRAKNSGPAYLEKVVNATSSDTRGRIYLYLVMEFSGIKRTWVSDDASVVDLHVNIELQVTTTNSQLIDQAPGKLFVQPCERMSLSGSIL